MKTEISELVEKLEKAGVNVENLLKYQLYKITGRVEK